MPSGRLTPNPKFQGFDSNGDPLSSGKLYTYAAGTTTNKTTYTTQGAGTANANPVILDSRGEADVWIDGSYKFVLKDSSDTTIWTVDNIGTAAESAVLSKTGAYTVAAADTGALILCNASGGAFTVTLPAAADQTSGFSVYIKKIDTSSNAITVEPNAAETLEDQTNWLVSQPYECIRITTDTVEWFISAMVPKTIYDNNGKEVLKIGTTASAVNEVTITNAATSELPIIAASGDDTNIGLILRGKGTGRIDLGTSTSTDLRLLGDQPITDSSGNEYIKFSKTASAVNELTITNAATGGVVAIAATGGDSAVGLSIDSKSTDAVTSTSSWDMGGATSFEIPNGAGGTTVDATGEVTIDSTSRTLNFYDGTAEVVLDPQLSKAITVESPGSAEDISMFFTEDAITITKMAAVLVGSATPSVTWTVRHHTDRSNAGNEVVTSGTTTTSTTTGSIVTTFNDATVPAASFVWLETSAQSGTVNSLNLTILYRIDA